MHSSLFWFGLKGCSLSFRSDVLTQLVVQKLLHMISASWQKLWRHHRMPLFGSAPELVGQTQLQTLRARLITGEHAEPEHHLQGADFFSLLPSHMLHDLRIRQRPCTGRDDAG